MLGTTFRALKVTSQVAARGAESAVYDCLVTAYSGRVNRAVTACVQVQEAARCREGRGQFYADRAGEVRPAASSFTAKRRRGLRPLSEAHFVPGRPASAVQTRSHDLTR